MIGILIFGSDGLVGLQTLFGQFLFVETGRFPGKMEIALQRQYSYEYSNRPGSGFKTDYTGPEPSLNRSRTGSESE
jgi:hypothetical protein